MTTHYVLPTELKQQLVTNITNADDTAKLVEMTEQASAWVEQVCNRRFDRYVDVRLFTALSLNSGGDLLTSNRLLLDADLIELLTDPGYTLLPLNAVNAYDRVSVDTSFTLNTDDLIEIDGVWGWGGEFAQVELLTEQLTSAATIITVADSTAYEVNTLLRIDNELLLVTALTDATTINVTRAHNGSTAVVHEIGAAVLRFAAHPLVRRLTIRYIQFMEDANRSPVSGSWSPFGDTAIQTSQGIGPPDGIFIALFQGLKRTSRPLSL